MNNQRPNQKPNRNKNPNNGNPLTPKRDQSGQNQGIRPPNPNRHRHPPKKGDSRFLNNRTRNPVSSPQVGQNTQNNQSFEKIFRRYEYLQEQHCIARRKYFENYYKADRPQQDKYEKSFYSSLEQIREYVSSLTAEQKAAFDKKYNGNPEDITYSKARNLPTPERVRFADKFPDPHVLKSQESVDFSKDTEESIGSFEDYEKYKGHT